MVRILLAGCEPPKSTFPIISLSSVTNFFPEDIILFSSDKWIKIKNLFAKQKVHYGMAISPLPQNVTEEILRSPALIKVIDLADLENCFDELITQFFSLHFPTTRIISQIPIPLMVFDLRDFIAYVENLTIPPGTDLVQYLAQRPDIVLEAGSQLKLLSANPLAVALYEGETEHEVVRYLNRVVHTYENISTIKLIQMVKEEDFSKFSVITRIRTIKGTIKIVKVNWLTNEFEPHSAPSVLIDITPEQEKFQQVLATSKIYGQIFENSPLAITIANSQGILIFVNHAFEVLIGYSKSEIIGRPFTDFTHPDFIEQNTHSLKKLMTGKTSEMIFEKKYVRKTGEEIWVRLRVKKIPEPIMGEPASIALIEDITAEKIVEEFLETEQDLVFSIFEKAPIPMITMEVMGKKNPVFEIKSMNRMAMDLFTISHSKEDISNLTKFIFDRFPSFSSQLKTAISSTVGDWGDNPFSFSFISEIQHQQFRVMANSFYGLDTSNYRLVLFLYNLTTEIEVINEYRNLSLFSEVLGKRSDLQGFFSSSLRFLSESFDATTAIFHGNDDSFSLEAMVEHNAHGLVEHHLDEHRRYILPILAYMGSSSQQIFSLEPSSFDLASIFGTAVAERISMPVSLVLVSPLYLQGSMNWMVAVFLHDPSMAQPLVERKFQNLANIMQLSFNKLMIMENLKEELKRRKEAERRLMDQTEKLTQLNQDLEQFVYAASHDLQEPLRTISSYLDLARLKLPQNDYPDVLSHIETAISASKRLRNLISDLRNYSMIGRDLLEFSHHPLYIVIQAAIKNIHHQIVETNSNIIISVPEDTQIYGNFSLLVTLFQNLISNGLKFNVSEQPTVEITLLDLATEIQINFSDNGIGIHEKNFNKIFKAFTRLHNRHEFQGIGMGLAICSKIVQVHNGRIDLESGKNGSTFKVILPKYHEG
ncbi:MAG: PAS domain S-box protein [Methanobacteriota archaeon]|nr:MAG: PAS domain S-box protein [Euryarchaeota archaeon]